MTRLLMTNLPVLYDITPTWHAEAACRKWGEGRRWMSGCGNKLQKDFSVSQCNHMNYCTRAYSKQSICYLLERSQQQQNSSQKKESESVQNKESTVRKIQENTRLDKAEEDKLSGRLPPWGLTAWELTGPALSRGYESTKHQTETVLPFKCQKGAPNIVLSWLDSNYLHLQATDTFLVAQLAIPKHLFISEGSRTAL